MEREGVSGRLSEVPEMLEKLLSRTLVFMVAVEVVECWDIWCSEAVAYDGVTSGDVSTSTITSWDCEEFLGELSDRGCSSTKEANCSASSLLSSSSSSSSYTGMRVTGSVKE